MCGMLLHEHHNKELICLKMAGLNNFGIYENVIMERVDQQILGALQS